MGNIAIGSVAVRSNSSSYLSYIIATQLCMEIYYTVAT